MEDTDAATAPSIPQLPHLVWRRIVYFLSDSLPELLQLSSLNPDLQRICLPYTSSFFNIVAEPIPPLSPAFYYHDLVWLVVLGHVDASFITDFCCVDQFNYSVIPPSTSTTPGTLATMATERQKRRFDRLLNETVRNRSLVAHQLEPEVLARFRRGDHDAALAILLPLCTALRMLEPPVGAKLCSALFRTIAQRHQLRGTNPQEAQRRAREAALASCNTSIPSKRSLNHALHELPFSELLIIHVRADQHGLSFPLIDIVPFMGIPSLLRIVLGGVRDVSFPGWPVSDIGITCPEIYFQESSVSRVAVLAFAEGISPPCEIRQWYERPAAEIGDSDPDDPDWDRILISDGIDGGKTIEARLDYDGGNPGYCYPWVSWLCHGKMEDWRRIDEEFELEADDEDLDWLKGLLA